MADEAMLPGRPYWLKVATQTVSATVQPPKYQINVDTMEQLAARTLELNAIGVAEISTDKPIVFEPYADNFAFARTSLGKTGDQFLFHAIREHRPDDGLLSEQMRCDGTRLGKGRV